MLVICCFTFIYFLNHKIIKNKKKLLCATQVLLRFAKSVLRDVREPAPRKVVFFFLLLFWFSFGVLALPFSSVVSTYVNVLNLRSNWFIVFIQG